ncbi:AzlC family ABC transporter permease [Treponema sp. J25]|uniref:AzlC family ABC transporter permease n=1 Tax=Treponema sp. J25 TaxID=2094121 RepID=UPI00104C483D|nr:AzlC family ABC transporter permease [Treponema sp. J25]TCW60452.1 branched-chain amino acid ABC transporter permease [Treponema sp. J25]
MKKSVVTYTIPVLLGYLPLGFAFGFLLVDAGYPWWLAPLMSLCMYAGAGQYIAVGLFAAGASLWEAVLVTLLVNARHVAYGMALLQRFPGRSWRRLYLIFALTDETFALLSSLPLPASPEEVETYHKRMFWIALLNHLYWIAGGTLGAIAGALLPFKIEGLAFALTALFIILMVEQIYHVRQARPFVVAGLAAIGARLVLPGRIVLLGSIVVALGILGLMYRRSEEKGGLPC